METKSWTWEKDRGLRKEKFHIDGDGYILKTLFSSICGTDLHVLNGNASIDNKISLGHEFVGKLDRVPANNNSDFKVGDQVIIAPGLPCGACDYCQIYNNGNWCKNRTSHGLHAITADKIVLGGFSEYIKLITGIRMYHIPPDLPFMRAVLAEPLTVAIRALSRARMNLRTTAHNQIVIVGLGPIGLMTALLARFFGEEVWGIDIDPYRINYAKKLGILVNCDANLFKYRLHGGIGADIVIECTGEPKAMQTCFDLIRRGGRIVAAGHFYPNGTYPLDPYLICRQDIEVYGTVLGDEDAYDDAINLLQQNEIPWDSIISHTFDFNKTDDAFRLAQSRQCMKVTVAF